MRSLPQSGGRCAKSHASRFECDCRRTAPLGKRSPVVSDGAGSSLGCQSFTALQSAAAWGKFDDKPQANQAKDYQKVELFALHLATTAALDPPHLQFQRYPRVAAPKIAHTAHLPFVPPHLGATATATGGFFERRLSVTTRAFRSPKPPRTVCSGRKPGNECRRLRFAARAIQHSCRISDPAVTQNTYTIHRFVSPPAAKSPTRFYQDPKQLL